MPIPTRGAFCDLSPATMARAAYLASFVGYNTDELWRTRSIRLSKKDLPAVMNMPKPTSDRFWRDVKDKYFYRGDNGFLHTIGQSFVKGKLDAPFAAEYQKLYTASLRELYRKIPITQHNRLGYALKMLPHINFEYNILCYTPTEKLYDEIVPMTVSEFCEIVGHSKARTADLVRDYGRLTFTVHNREEVFCKFVSDGSDMTNAHIYINPRLIYKGSDFHKVEGIGISFAADYKPYKQ